jgi:LruC domain-containing protein
VPLAPIDTVVTTVSYRTSSGDAAPGGDVVLADVMGTNFNPFIVVNQNRGTEVHLLDQQPTSLANAALLGTKDDKSNANLGQYYRTANNLPFALNIPESTPYMIEKAEITTGFLKLIDWAISGGTSFTDWYKNQPGYRNNANIY